MVVGTAYCLRKAVFRDTGQPSLRSSEGRHAPRSTDPRTNDENACPHNSESAQYEGRSNAESTNLQTIGVEGRTAPPLEPRVNTEIRRPTRAAKLEPERTTGCESTRGPRPASGALYLTAQVRRVHSVKEQRPHSDSNTCLLPRGTTRPRKPATLPSAVQTVGVPAVVCDGLVCCLDG